MSVSRFTEDATEAVLTGLRARLSLADAAREAGVPLDTVKGWLKRGRREEQTDYALFAEAVDEARETAATAPMDEVEFMSHVERAVRGGSVQAMKLWWAICGPDEGEPESPFAEFVHRANGHGGAS